MSKKRFIEFVFISFGVLAMGFGFYFFNMPHNLIIGGVSGLGVILTETLGLNVALLILIMNVFFLIIGLLYYGVSFFLKTIYGSLLFPFAIYLAEFLDNRYQILPISEDLLLSVIFSALLIGFGIGIVFRFGGTTGGVDIPQKILHERLKIPFSVSMYIIDGIIVLIGSIVFGLEIGLYSILAMLLIGKFVDIVLIGGNNTKSVYVITTKPEEMKQKIYDVIYRGVTEVPIVGGYSKEGKTMLLCVVRNREYYQVMKIINTIDEHAFAFVNNSHEVLGEGFGQST